MNWKTLFQLLYVGLMVFGLWMAKANATPLTESVATTEPVVSTDSVAAANIDVTDVDLETAVVVVNPVGDVAVDAIATDRAPAAIRAYGSPIPESITEVVAEPSLVSRGPTAKSCPDIAESEGEMKVRQLKFATGVCSIRVSEKGKYPQRGIGWNSQGRMEITVEINPAANSKGVPMSDPFGGARTYFIMPVDNVLSVDGTRQQGPDYEVKTSSEMIWSFGKASREFRLPSECTGRVQPASKNNDSGVELGTCQGHLVIDLGWRTGLSPDYHRPDGDLTIRDPQGHSCRLKNNQILKYTAAGKADEETAPRFKTAEEWYRFIRSEKACANLKVDFLQPQKSTKTVQKNGPAPLPTEYAQ